MNDDELAGLGALAGLSTMIFVFILIGIAILIVPYWFITKRLGWSPWWSLLMLLPFGAIVWPYYVAFARWPIDDRRPGGPPTSGL